MGKISVAEVLVSGALYIGWFSFHCLYYRDTFEFAAGIRHSRFVRILNSFTICALAWLVFSVLFDKILPLPAHFLEHTETSNLLFIYTPLLLLSSCTFVEMWDLFLLFDFLPCVLICISSAVSSFSTRLAPPPATLHTVILLINLLLIAAEVSFFCTGLLDYQRASSERGTLLALFAGSELCLAFKELICHLLFIFDRANGGGSIQTHRRITFVSVIAEAIAILILLFYNLVVLVCGSSHSILRGACFGVQVWLQWRTLMAVRHLFTLGKRVANEFPAATEADLAREDTCIVCRYTMTTDTAKRLPCGHCLHAECAERWLTRQSSCPLCQKTVR
jgi:hypothetical protein